MLKNDESVSYEKVNSNAKHLLSTLPMENFESVKVIHDISFRRNLDVNLQFDSDFRSEILNSIASEYY